MPTMMRVIIRLPADQVRAIDAVASNRSRFIAAAVARELERRRREGLRASLEAPHPESSTFAGLGFATWGAVAGDDDLVDPLAGEPVTWEPGTGWKART